MGTEVGQCPCKPRTASDASKWERPAAEASPEPLRGARPACTSKSDFWPPGCEGINFCSFKPRSCGVLLQAPQEALWGDCLCSGCVATVCLSI